MKIYFLRWRLAVTLAVSMGLLVPTLAEEPNAGAEQPTPARVANAAEPVGAAEGNAPVESPAAAATSAAVELVQERYPSGAVKIEREMVLDPQGNYIPHGAWRFFDEQGRLFIDGRFEQGQRVGVWRRFYRGDEASLLATMPYKEFTAPLISTATFQAGHMHGTWTITDALHRKVHELELRDGQRHGAATWYYPSGAVFMRGNYQQGLPDGEILQLSADGNVQEREQYVNGRRLTKKREHHDAQQQTPKQEISYLEGALVVKAADNWDSCGFATLEIQGPDEQHGPFSIWHANGQLARQGEFEHDVLVGKVIAWHPNGQEQFEGESAQGKLDGAWTWWHANGQKAISGEFQQGVAIGTWSWWATTGELAKRTDYSKERPVVITPADDSVRSARVQVEDGLPLR